MPLTGLTQLRLYPYLHIAPKRVRDGARLIAVVGGGIKLFGAHSRAAFRRDIIDFRARFTVRREPSLAATSRSRP